jgi:hypothetical protein
MSRYTHWEENLPVLLDGHWWLNFLFRVYPFWPHFSSLAVKDIMAPQKKPKQAVQKKAQPLIKKPRRKARVERILKKREPLLVENTKKSIFIRGHRTSQITNDTLKDLVCNALCYALLWR